MIYAGALTFVVYSVLLTLYARLPFPPPGETILYDPTDWTMLFDSAQTGPVRGGAPAGGASFSGQSAGARAGASAGGPSIGGLSTTQPPVAILLYKAHPGDTMGSIATRLGLTVDTLSSMNRVQGRGVHTVIVGELLKVPSQDGIPVSFDGDFDALTAKYKDTVTPDEVLAANGITRAELKQGMVLFLPRVQHTGPDLALSTGTFVARPLIGYESSPFGWRQDPFTGVRSHHSGVDIAAPMGSPIRSSTDGTVVAARWDNMLGNYVEVRYLAGYSYVYGHMSVIKTQVGARVQRGQLIGLVGDTGYATGPHLHFEVRRYGVPLNPKFFLSGIR